MVQFATTQGENTIRQIARRLYDARDADALRRAEEALAQANPALAEIRRLAPGTPLEVPDVRGVEVTAAAADLTVVARATALHGLREGLPDLAHALREAANAQVSIGRERVKGLARADITRLARDDPALTDHLEAATREAADALARAEAMRKDQPAALKQLDADVGRLLGLFSA